MNFKPTPFKTIFGLILVCILTFVAVVNWMDDPLNLRAPQDQQLLAIFHDHREAFKKMQQMATEDAKQGWYFEPYLEYMFKGSKPNSARLQQYSNLLSEIHAQSVSTDYDNSMRFCFAGGGLSAISPGWVKGIEYEPGNYQKTEVFLENQDKGPTLYKRKGVLMETLDNAHKLSPGVYFRQIETNWFIFYQRTDD